jgi:hypothetical protein
MPVIGLTDHRKSRDASIHAVAMSVLPLATILIILCFFAVTSADADLWGHLLFGRDIVSSGSVHQRDLYSFTSDLPWVNHEWLAEVIMWVTYAVGGNAGLVALKLVVICISGALLLESWRPRCMNPMRRDGLLLVAALGSWPVLITIRPQIFSVLLFAVLLFAIVRVQAGRLQWLILIPMSFAVWVNVHGGWLAGAATLVVFLATFAIEKRFDRRHLVIIVATLAATVMATLCNPYGRQMLSFLWETVGPSRSDIMEWQPVTRLPAIAFALWLLPTSVAVVALWQRGRSIPLSFLSVIALLGAGSFLVIRLVAFYSLASAFLLSPFLGGQAVRPHQDQVKRSNRWISSCVAMSMIAVAVMGFGRHITMGAEYLPEPEASAYVLQHRLTGKMFTWFDYGEYAIWHFWPAIHVSMDGRRETVYSQRIRDVHFEIYRNAPGAIDALRGLQADYAWLPVNAPVVPTLEANGWRAGFKGPRSVILCRNSVPPVQAVVDSPSREPRRFPGP